MPSNRLWIDDEGVQLSLRKVIAEMELTSRYRTAAYPLHHEFETGRQSSSGPSKFRSVLDESDDVERSLAGQVR